MKKCLHYLYKIFFFMLIVTVNSCEKEEIDSSPLNTDDPEMQSQSARKLVNIEQIPELRNVLNDLASKQQKNASAKGMITPILDYENILENTEESGKRSYSLRFIENMGEDFAPFSFKNLYLIETGEGIYDSFILEYIPEPTWFKANDYRMDVSNYTGTIKRYSSSNELEEKVYLVDGEMVEMGDKNKEKNKSIMLCFYVGRTCTCDGDLVGDHEHFSMQVVVQCVVLHHPANSGGSGSGGGMGNGTGAPAPGPGYGFPGGSSSGGGGGYNPDIPNTPGTITLYPNIFLMSDVVKSRLPGALFSAHRAWVDGQADNNTMSYLYAYAMNNRGISARFFLINLIAGAMDGAISDEEIISILTFIQDEYGSEKAMAFAKKAVIIMSDSDKLNNPSTPGYLDHLRVYIGNEIPDPYLMHYFSMQCASLKLKHPEWSNIRIFWEVSKEMIHLGLDIVGLVPVIGEGADLINGAIYLVEGDAVNASLSLAATVPFVGWTATGSKLIVKVVTNTAGEKALKIIAEGADEIAALASKLKHFTAQVDNAINSLKSGARYVLEGTGAYRQVAGHHPLSKKAFEGDVAYDLEEAFSVSSNKLNNYTGLNNTHNLITGRQNSLYSEWKNANPNTTMTIENMANIEVQAMIDVGVPSDVAKGWVVKALEDLKNQGVSEIKNIPWNNVNPN